MTNTLHRLTLTALTAALLLGLLACGQKEASGDKKIVTQVAAKVGTEEISVHQINQVLSRANASAITPEAAQTLSKDVLEKLIDQQLAVEQATLAKLHRTPEVVAQIEAARKEILARAYLQSIAAPLAKPSPEETQLYFTEHPQLFSQRRIYTLQEVAVPAPSPEVADQLRAFAAAGKPLDEAAGWLKSRNVKFSLGKATRAAEQVPQEFLTKLHLLADGQGTFMQTAQGATLVHLVASQSSPVDLDTATPRIEQFLSNQRASEAVATQLKQLRANTKIEYTGDFASPATTLEKGVADLK